MQNEHPKEQVLVISTGLATALCNYQVFGPPSPILEKIILENHSFRERQEAETNFSFKQVIPYVVVSAPLRPGVLAYLLTQRTNQQQESRLHNKYSIGQGGHINDLDFKSDTTNQSPILVGLMREIKEEFHLDGISTCEPVGVLNDDSNEVSRVHLGLVYRVHVVSQYLEVAEHGKHTAQWATASELEGYYANMERWSQIVMEHVIRAA